MEMPSVSCKLKKTMPSVGDAKITKNYKKYKTRETKQKTKQGQQQKLIFS
jgi:hypothetical protein